MKRFLAFSDGVAKAGGYLSISLILLASLQTLADIVLRLTTGRGILGTTDITQLLMMAIAASAIQYAFYSGSHISINLLTPHLPASWQKALSAVGGLASLVLLLIIFRTGLDQAALATDFGDKTTTIGIPKAWFWYAFHSGIVLSILGALAGFLRRVRLVLQ